MSRVVALCESAVNSTLAVGDSNLTVLCIGTELPTGGAGRVVPAAIATLSAEM